MSSVRRTDGLAEREEWAVLGVFKIPGVQGHGGRQGRQAYVKEEMKRSACRVREAAVLLVILWAVIVTLFCSGHLILNTTGSVPRGLWWRSGGPLQYGDIVLVPTSAFRSTSWVPEAYWRKNAWGKPKAFLKRVAGFPGDVVGYARNGLIHVNGGFIPNSAPLSADKAGRPLKALQLPITLASDEVWLLSDSPRGFDSRYLGPARISECKRVIPIHVYK